MIVGTFWKGISLQTLNLSDILNSMPFIKGHVGFNKGLKLAGEYRNCLRCNKNIWFVQSRILKGGGKYCSRDCSNKSTAKKGQESHHYKEKVGYYAVHDWLYLNFGNPAKCEFCNKEGGLNKAMKWNTQWARIKGKSYERSRENFMGLCSKCHMYYDGTVVTMQKKNI